MNSANWLIGVAAVICCAQSQAGVLHEYTVRVDPSLERMTISACFDGKVPERLIAEDTAPLYLESMQLRNAPSAQLTVQGWEAVLSNVPDSACIDYAVQLRPITTGVQKGGPETRRIGRDLLTSIGDWFWRPEVLPADGDIEIRFELPAGVSVSAPWEQVEDTGGKVFRVGATPQDWPGVVAFGGFWLIPIDVPGARLNLAILDGPTPAQRDFLARWVERIAAAATTGYGTFPVPNLQVVVAPTPRGREPVPWAYVSRGGGSAVHLFVNPKSSEYDFSRDWSVMHEFSHLFLPYVTTGDAWLFEGLPTYFQNVLMARGGLIAPEEAWRRMNEGFERAERVGSGLSLEEASQRIGRVGLYQRVYWGGAAYMLAADLRLREGSDGRVTLSQALAEIRRCCTSGAHRWSAEDLIVRLDAATNTRVFSDLAGEMLTSSEFPDYRKLYARLGIQMLGGHPIFVDAPSARHRNAIMAPQ